MWSKINNFAAINTYIVFIGNWNGKIKDLIGKGGQRAREGEGLKYCPPTPESITDM